MRKPYDETGFVRLCWEKLLTLIVLNLLFWLSAVPLFTLPAAITALARACQGCLMDEPRVLGTYLHSLRIHLLRAMPLGVLFLGGTAAIAYGCLFYYQASRKEELAVLLLFFCLACIYLVFCIGAFAFQMYARVELRLLPLLKNAFCLTFQQSGTVFGWLLLSFGILTSMGLLLPHSVPWLLLLGASLPCMTAARGILPVIDTKIIKE